ncbi:hypothetical protein C8R45DRAFT_940865 [Mycena sanguinolenta]|nr:hypothetical protein C8R45DRAFT_940865 [Mycena sanguinolenta]
MALATIVPVFIYGPVNGTPFRPIEPSVDEKRAKMRPSRQSVSVDGLREDGPLWRSHSLKKRSQKRGRRPFIRGPYPSATVELTIAPVHERWWAALKKDHKEPYADKDLESIFPQVTSTAHLGVGSSPSLRLGLQELRSQPRIDSIEAWLISRHNDILRKKDGNRRGTSGSMPQLGIGILEYNPGTMSEKLERRMWLRRLLPKRKVSGTVSGDQKHKVSAFQKQFPILLFSATFGVPKISFGNGFGAPETVPEA